MLNVYWASPEDYENRELSIDYRTSNAGPGTAYSSEVTHSTATDGAYLITSMPMALGDIAESSYSDYMLKYHVPEGVGSIQTTVYVKCQDGTGTSHYYPDKTDFYAYNQANQLTEVLDQDANTTSFTYDANGALVDRTMGTSSMTFSYNGMDKLTHVESPTGTVNYSYDALGRRITRSEDAYERKLVYGDASDLYDHELDTEGALVASMLKGPDGLISLTSYVGGTITAYQNFNPHGDTTLISSPQGEEWIAARFDAFGNPLDGWELSYGYTSKWLREKDRDTMMIRMGVREYDPALGRFVSADPLMGKEMNPQQRNRYNYAGNNPLTVYDLNGMWWGGDALGWVKEKASEVRDFVQRPEFALWTGHVEDPLLWGAGRDYMPESVLEITDKINDPRVSTGLLVGIGIPGKTGWVKCTDEISGMTIPLRARNIAQYVKNKGAPPQGYKGGVTWPGKNGHSTKPLFQDTTFPQTAWG